VLFYEGKKPYNGFDFSSLAKYNARDNKYIQYTPTHMYVYVFMYMYGEKGVFSAKTGLSLIAIVA